MAQPMCYAIQSSMRREHTKNAFHDRNSIDAVQERAVHRGLAVGRGLRDCLMLG